MQILRPCPQRSRGMSSVMEPKSRCISTSTAGDADTGHLKSLSGNVEHCSWQFLLFTHKVAGEGEEQAQNDNFNVLLLGQTDLTMENPTEFWE